MRVIGTAATYPDLLRILAQRRRELGISQRALDDACGVPDGYVGKLEVGTRNLGPMSMQALLGALGLRIAVFEADEPLPARVQELVGSCCATHNLTFRPRSATPVAEPPAEAA